MQLEKREVEGYKIETTTMVIGGHIYHVSIKSCVIIVYKLKAQSMQCKFIIPPFVSFEESCLSYMTTHPRMVLSSTHTHTHKGKSTHDQSISPAPTASSRKTLFLLTKVLDDARGIVAMDTYTLRCLFVCFQSPGRTPHPHPHFLFGL